uniref:STAS domain-containing protein n=1 Tax=Magnetococcus massalia (strain MO-1) TaxID=451514 RepID=A0A1S7LPI5_MAGMO|nr:Conserved protein of unknown function. putative Anti-sigma-factor antagonist [Candidatus Magnetococcus massalia]
MSQRFAKQYSKAPERLIVTLTEPFNYNAYTAFHESYKDESGQGQIEFDFRHVDTIDSAALGMLLIAREHYGNDNNRVFISNLNGYAQKVVMATKLDSMFTII